MKHEFSWGSYITALWGSPPSNEQPKRTCRTITIPLICFYQQRLAEKERIPKAEEGHQKRKSRSADAERRERREGGHYRQTSEETNILIKGVKRMLAVK